MRAEARAMVLTLASFFGATSGCDAGHGHGDEVRREPEIRPVRFETSPPRVELGPEAMVLYRRALVRDRAPSCADLVADLEQPTEALLEVVDRTTAPPSAGMRAATCLVREHAPEMESRMTRWVRSRETMGLALLVLGELDRLEPALADRLARAALAGENAARARPRIARSERFAHLLAAVSSNGAAAPR